MNEEFGPVDLTGVKPDKLLGNYHCGSAILQAELTRQRRHRKWALKEARMMSRLAYTENESYQEQAHEVIKLKAEVERLRKMQPIANVTLSGDAEYFKTQADKSEAEVKRLKALLANLGTVF